MGTVGTTGGGHGQEESPLLCLSPPGVSMVGGVLTVIGGVLTIATMGAAAPLLIAGSLVFLPSERVVLKLSLGTAVGVAGGLGGITKNILVGKKKSGMQTSAETAMENLRRLEEEFKQVVIELCLEMEAMTAEQKIATQQMLALTKNTSVRNSVKSVREDDTFKKMGATKGYKKDAVGTATLVLGVSARTVAREFSEEVLEMSAKSFGKAAGGLMVGVGALFLVSDGVTITKSAMRLWKQVTVLSFLPHFFSQEPSKAADMLRDLAGKLELEQEQASGDGGRVTDLSCPICWDSLTSLVGVSSFYASFMCASSSCESSSCVL